MELTSVVQGTDSRLFFKTLALMRAHSDADLVQGTPATLVGGSALGDQTSNIYYWDTTSTATDDGETVIKLTNTTTGRFLIADGYKASGAGSVTRTRNDKLGETVSVEDFGAACDWNGTAGTDDTAAVQSAIDWCIANDRDLEIPAMCKITSSLEIDRAVDAATADHYFTISSSSGGGFAVAGDVVMFSTSLVNPSDANLPATQLVKFKNIKFEADVNTRVAYVLDQNKYLRTSFESCNFRKIKCLSAPAGKLTQSISFINCQSRRWTGDFFKSDEATFDLKVIGGLWEAGGEGFNIDFPVGAAFMGSNIEGMATYAIKYTGGYGLCINGNYFEGNGIGVVGGCSIDGSAGIGVDASECVSISGNYFSGDGSDTTKPQIKWGQSTASVSKGNLCTTTLHEFDAFSRVNVIADYARVALSTNDTSSYSDIRNQSHIGQLYRAEAQDNYGGIVRSTFTGGLGAFLKLRTFNGGTESAKGLDIDYNGDTVTSGELRQNPSDNVDPSVNGELVIQATSNTTLTFKLKGTDGTIRSGAITLS